MYQKILDKFNNRNHAAFCSDTFSMDSRKGLVRYRGNEETVVIPYGTKVIYGGAFADCRNVREIIIPDTVVEIAIFAFSHCEKLETLICGFGLTEIPMGLCSDLKELKTVVFTDHIHWIDTNGFYGCRNLETPLVIQRTFREPVTAEEKGLAFESLVMGLPEGVEELTVTPFQTSPVNTAPSAFEGCSLLRLHNAEQKATVVQAVDEVSTVERPEDISMVEVLEDVSAAQECEQESIAQGLKDAQSAESEDAGPKIITSDSNQNTISNYMDTEDLLIPGYALCSGGILHCSTGQRITDRTIMDWDLSPISIMLFRRAGTLYSDNITLSQVLKLQQHQLSKLRRVTAKQIEDAIAEFTQLLESLFVLKSAVKQNGLESDSISAVTIIGEEDNREVEATDQLCPDILPAKAPELEAEPLDSPISYSQSVLVSGFTLVDEYIISESGDHLPNLPIRELNFSTRAARTLIRAKITTLWDLLLMSEKELLAVQGMGQTSVAEIKKELAAHFSAVDGRKDSENTNEQEIMTLRSLLIPGYTLEGEYIFSESGERIPNKHVQELQLSVRATNSLLNAKISTIGELMLLNEEALYAIRNTGRTTVEELKKKLVEYLSSAGQNPVSEKTSNAEIILEPKSSGSSLQFPALDPFIPVLAPEYAQVDDTIFARSTGTIIMDQDINCLELSVRPNRCLRGANLHNISQLINLPFSTLKRIPSLGTLSVNEISEKLEQFLAAQISIDSTNQEIQQKNNHVEERISDYMCRYEFAVVTTHQIVQELSDISEEDIAKALNVLVEKDELCTVPEGYCKKHIPVLEYINNAPTIDDRLKDVVLRRAEGETLEQIGLTYGMTRERVRQLEKKVFRQISARQLVFEEDRYQYLFSTYEIEKEFLDDPTGYIWYYLNSRYSAGKAPAEKALEDQMIPVALRRSLDRWIHRNAVLVNGIYIPKQRTDIEDYILENYCKDEVHIDDFFLLYEEFLQQYTLTEEALQLNESVKRSRSNRLSEAQNVLWKPYQRLRWYDIDTGNYEELLAALNLGQYQNIEISSRRFFLNHPELMQHYDIRDEYELHNLLKKIHAEKDNPTMVFGRMPNIQFGAFDRDMAVRSMLHALSPVTGDVLAEALSAEYGHKKESIMTSWLSCISANYHHGVYTVNNIEMPPNHAKLLKAQLTDDFYSFDEVRYIYCQMVDDADVSVLTPYNLRQMGFFVGTSYVLQHHPTAEAYFRSLLSARDVFDITPINRRFDRLSTYRLIEKEMRRNREIIEFEPGQYIHIRRLRKLGITQEMLQNYCDHVWSFYPEEGFFSLASLRQDGFESELDALGFDELFYVSLLRESDHFSWQKVGGCIILGPPGKAFSTRDFLVDLVVRAGSMDLDDLVHLLQDRYHVALSRIDVLTETKGSGLYYDKIMDRLYADYDTYFEEI